MSAPSSTVSPPSPVSSSRSPTTTSAVRSTPSPEPSAGLEVLEDEIERRRAAVGGKASYILVPGIDVPFHSGVLRGGVDDFRAKLDELLPSAVDPAPLLGRYVPNLVARAFALDKPFLESILEVAPADPDRSGPR
jgi:hypothetical protein